MSEVHEEADEASANEQGSGGEKSYPEWLQGEPDVDRLVSYADNLRKERAENKQRLAAWDDEESAFRQVQERFPHWLEGDSEEPDTDDEYDDEDDPRDEKLSELEARQQAHDEWIAKQELEASEKQFRTDVHAAAAAADIELDDDDLSLIKQKGQELGGEKGWGREELVKAVEWLVARDKRVAERRLEQVKSSKRAPHTPTGGTAGKGPQPDMSTQAGREEFYKHRLANG